MLRALIKPLGLFTLLWMLAIWVYAPVAGSHFTFDFVDWYFTYQQYGWKGLLTSFNDPSLHHVYHLFYFCAIQLLGFNAYAWVLLFTAMHAANASLMYYWLKGQFQDYGVLPAQQAALFSSLLFLLSPYQTETVAWGATIHYLLVMAEVWIILLLSKQADSVGRRATTLAVFALGMFTHEIIIVLPAVLLGFSLLGVSGYKSVGRVVKQLVLPMAAIVALYFLLNRLFLGQWVAHYGAETHLRFSLQDMTLALQRYAAKYLLFAGMLPDNIRQILYQPQWMIFVTPLALLFFGIVYFMIPSAKSSRTLWLAFAGASIVFLFPVLNLYFPFWIPIQGDRLGYLASPFLYALLFLVVWILAKRWTVIVMSLLLIISLFGLMQRTTSWQSASALMYKLEENFVSDTSKHTYILNLPDNLNGAYMYRNLGASKFAQAYRMRHGVNMNHHITEVLGYNLQSAHDSVRVQVVDSITLKVEFTRYGSWFWRNCQGAENYENDLLKVEIDEYGLSYLVQFKKKSPTDRFLYQAADRWIQVNDF